MTSLHNAIMHKMDEMIESHMFYKDIPGLAAGILFQNEMIYGKGFGVTDLSKKTPMTTEAVFHMASISKIFTATAVMQLAEKGLVSIDLPLLRYIPELRVASHESYLKDITVRQMLSHTAGLPDCEDYEWDQPRFDERALRDYVLSLGNLQLTATPGSRFNYSNIAYEMLGYLIEVMTGETFEDYCKQNIFEPAGMVLTDFRKNSVDGTNLVQPHIKNSANHVQTSPVFPYNRAHAPSSTLYSNIHELGMFTGLMMNTLKGTAHSILQPATLSRMLTPQSPIKKDEQIGLGWFISEYHGKRFYGHEGHDIGFRTTFAMIPDESLALIVLANLETASTRKIMRLLFDLTQN
jgi:CubicO group peptidase (beta-lactamase class C family)